MKPLKSFASAAICAAFVFASCSKDNSFQANSAVIENGIAATHTTSTAATTTYDRIDAIMKDVSIANYSLNFDQAMPESGITRTAYGVDNYLSFADPRVLKVPDAFLSRYKLVPIWRRPNSIPPTCPDMAIDVSKLKEIADLLKQADYKKYGALKQVSLLSGGAFLGDDIFLNQFPNMKYDRIDDITKDLSNDKFLMLNQPSNYSGGFTRSFYGYADLNRIVFRPYGKNLIDIFKPTLKGCFDPIVLKTIRERLQKMDPVTYKYLTVTPLRENQNIATLYNQY